MMSHEISYSLRKSRRAKSLRISVYPDGRCVVSAPTFVGEHIVERFVRARAEWIMKTLQKFMPFTPIARRKNSRKEFLKHKEVARALVKEKLPKFNRHYGFRVGKIAIRNQKSRWGSCSARGNLNFNYRIALLPAHLADYIIVHELCHIGEFNHSQKFWDLVAETMPNYRELRAELKRIRIASLV